jgi:hypothetical protein
MSGGAQNPPTHKDKISKFDGNKLNKNQLLLQLQNISFPVFVANTSPIGLTQWNHEF